MSFVVTEKKKCTKIRLRKERREKSMTATPLAKQSKRAQKAYYSRSRGSWHGVNPATKTMESKKAYSRNRLKSERCAQY